MIQLGNTSCFFNKVKKDLLYRST